MIFLPILWLLVKKMTEDALNQQQILETDFAVALDDIESSDVESRRQGAARLEKIGGNRSYQVASVLVGDADPVVASIARRICSSQRKAGLVWRGSQVPVRPAERKVLGSVWQILDEVVFTCRRNMSELLQVGFIAALPKLLLIFFIYAGPYVLKDFHEFVAVPVLFFALGAHQIFWRPLTWLGIGRAFIGGFPDRLSRQQARGMNIWQLYRQMLTANLVPAIAYSVLLIYTYSSLYSRFNGFALLIAWAVFWIMFWEPFLMTNPLVLFKQKSASVFDGMQLHYNSRLSLVRLNFVFFFVLLVLYLMLYTSSVAGCAFLGMSLQPLGLKVPTQLWYIALLIGADCLLDPFIVGYRILLTRLSLNRAES